MAVTGHSLIVAGPVTRRHLLLGGLAAGAQVCAGQTGAPLKEEWRAVLSGFGQELANGNASEALSYFDRNFPQRSTLGDYLAALIAAYDIASEFERTDEARSDSEIEIQGDWTLTLTNRDDNVPTRRSRHAVVRMRRPATGAATYKIVALKPLELFDPAKGS